MTARTVLVVGATKGIGLGLVEKYLADGWRVVATTIEASAGLDRLVAAHSDRLDVLPLDITDVAAVTALRDDLAARGLDVLHIVAGVYQATFAPIWEQPGEEILRVLNTNAIGAIRMAELFSPVVRKGGVFAFTSSGMGSMTRNTKGNVDLYRISKAALNMLARSFSAYHAGSGRAVLLLCPGWAKTDMGGPDATIEIADSVAGMVKLVTEADTHDDEARFFEYSGDAIAW
jgi:NAD(P)-dependent dehydrogenase (short-subunit alcohol dehydrogenase family)